MFRGSEKGLKETHLRNVLLDQFNECEETRSLNNIFIFKESKKKGLKKTPQWLLFSVNADEIKKHKCSLAGCCFRISKRS
jgi:hypothetical protein